MKNKISDALPGLRKKVDNIDSKIVSLLAERVETALEIEECKRGDGKPIYVKDIEEKRLRKVWDEAMNLGLNVDFANFVKSIFPLIIAHCRKSEEVQRQSAEKQ